MNNSIPEELGHFNQLAEAWWNTNGPMRTLHDITPWRIDYLQKNAPLAGKTVLDIGCGAGILTEAMAKNNANVTGIDLAEKLIHVAKEHQTKPLITYEIASAEDFAHDHPESFEVVTCLEMLEHVPRPDQIVHAAAKLCQPGGTIIFSTINRTLPAYISTIIAAEWLLKLIPKNTHHYKNYIKPSELACWCRKAGLEVHCIDGMGYNPISGHAYTTRSTKSNYILCCKKPKPSPKS